MIRPKVVSNPILLILQKDTVSLIQWSQLLTILFLDLSEPCDPHSGNNYLCEEMARERLVPLFCQQIHIPSES